MLDRNTQPQDELTIRLIRYLAPTSYTQLRQREEPLQTLLQTSASQLHIPLEALLPLLLPQALNDWRLPDIAPLLKRSLEDGLLVVDGDKLKGEISNRFGHDTYIARDAMASLGLIHEKPRREYPGFVPVWSAS